MHIDVVRTLVGMLKDGLSLHSFALRPKNSVAQVNAKKFDVLILAMMGFVIGLGTELLTGQGILSQIGLG